MYCYRAPVWGLQCGSYEVIQLLEGWPGCADAVDTLRLTDENAPLCLAGIVPRMNHNETPRRADNVRHGIAVGLPEGVQCGAVLEVRGWSKLYRVDACGDRGANSPVAHREFQRKTKKSAVYK